MNLEQTRAFFAFSMIKIDAVGVELSTKYKISLNVSEDRVFDVSLPKQIFAKEIGKSNVEIVGIICLDFNNRIINYANVATGNIATVKASVAQICKIALLSNASKVIVAHNHPDGCLKITDEDVTMTRKMAAALKLFDIQLMDSMIVNPNGEVVSIRKYVESEQ